MSTQTQTVKIGDVDYTIRKLSLGERNRIRDVTTSIDLATGFGKISVGKAQILRILFGVVTPKFKDEQHVEELDPETGDKLDNAIKKFNNELATVPLEPES